MIRHVVLLQFSGVTKPDDIKDVLGAIKANAVATPGMVGFAGGKNLQGGGLNQGFTHCYTLDFVDAKARDAYLDRLDNDETCWRLSDMTVGGLGGILSMNIDVTDITSSE
ncbi:Dabb family protein [Thalassospira lohafexi]|uniref:Stress responsive protein n=1 Tax=Thalassospira lohafexi TaxID=744227 RepID=A0A2N3L7X4_9PROT|nr:Dabb family protein [Thalassospira lohafexi]PKR58915.1 stress responsive protein [Thalassospira lohafexi]